LEFAIAKTYPQNYRILNCIKPYHQFRLLNQLKLLFLASTTPLS